MHQAQTSVAFSTNTKQVTNNLKSALLCSALLATMITGTVNAETPLKPSIATINANITESYANLAPKSTQTEIQKRSDNNNEYRYLENNGPNQTGVWIARIGTLLFNDPDGDSFHSGFSLSIDVDCDYGDTEVYAEIYLTDETGAMQHFYQTNPFSVYSVSSIDEYRVDSELLSYRSEGYYQVRIDIHDNWSGSLLDSATAWQYPNLENLPLESEEGPSGSTYLPNTTTSNDDPINSSAFMVAEYGGQFGPFGLLALLGAALLRRKQTNLKN